MNSRIQLWTLIHMAIFMFFVDALKRLDNLNLLLAVFGFLDIFDIYGPTVGVLNAENLKITFPRNKINRKVVPEYAFFLRMCTIICMREATYISNGFRIRAGP